VHTVKHHSTVITGRHNFARLFAKALINESVDSTETIWDAKYNKYLEKGMDEEDAIQQSNQKITPLVQRQFIKRYGDVLKLIVSNPPPHCHCPHHHHYLSFHYSFKNSRHQIKHQTDGDFSSKHAELQFHHWCHQLNPQFVLQCL
jgi:hypothetical protein